MKTAVIRSSWMEGYGYRLDCSPYLGGALETKLILKNLPLRKDKLVDLAVGGLSGIYYAGRESIRWVPSPELGIPCLGATDITKADLSGIPLISKEQVRRNPLFLIRSGWTLITRSGTTGRLAYVRREMDGMACQDVLRILPNTAKVPSGYLYAYLGSKFGIPLVGSSTYGSIIQHLEPEQLLGLPVPRLSDALEQKVHTLIEEAAELLTEHSKQLAAATALFFDCFGLSDITSLDWERNRSKDLGFTVSGPIPHSIRAIHFAPRFRELCDRFSQRHHEALGILCLPGTLCSGPRFKRIDAAPEHAIRLVGQKELFNLKPEGRLIARSSVGDEVRMKAGTIAVAAQGTFGETELYCRSQFIWGLWTEFAYSQHMLRVVADESKMLRGCLFAFFRSETAFRILRAISTGSKLQDNHYYFLPRLPIPVPKRKDQEKIHEMVIDAFEKRQRAVANEDRAIALVEKSIDAYGK